MISFEDCVALCGLDRAEVDAIAEHEHIPEIAAAALAGYLLRCANGECEVRRMIVDDLRIATASGNIRHAAELMMALRHFLSNHPDGAAQKSAA